MERRLHAARREVRRATILARSALLSSGGAVLGLGVDDDDVNDPASSSPCHHPTPDDDDDNDVVRLRGADLGLALFGTSESYARELEEERDRKLRVLEDDLEGLLSGLHDLERDGGGGGDGIGGGRQIDDNDDVDGGGGGEDATIAVDDVVRLRAHVSFLRGCATAIKLLEEVDGLSFETNFAASSGVVDPIDDKGGSFGGSASSSSSPRSPFGVVDADDFARFAFGPPPSSSSSSKASAESPMVRAARTVRRAEEVLDGAVGEISVGRSENDDHDRIHDDRDDRDDMARMQASMLHELRHRARRHRMELRHRASALADGCVAIDRDDDASGSGSGSMSVSGIGGGDAAAPVPPSSASMQTNDSTISSPSPLSDAYLVLELFSDSNFPTFGDTLDGAMRRLSRKLLDAVLPCLAELEGRRGVDGYEDDEEEKEGGGAVGYYKFARESIRGVRSSKTDRKHDPVTIKGPAVRLRWTLANTSKDEGGDVDVGTDAALARGGGGGGRIATSDEIDGGALRALAAEVSPSIAAFLSVLNFLSNSLSFVHRHALLRRPDLAGMLGRHLFGVHPMPNASISSGSAVLGVGNLVGAAAIGVENGDEMPLMSELVKCMRRCCIPKARSPEVWQMLQKVEQFLVTEVAAFEEKLVGMGLMKDSSTSDSSVGVACTRGMPESQSAASSPTGLSVFVTEKTKILSPLSELAISLRQAYVEGQRSQILIRGRSILLDTDYHNTVQVGTFVPEPSDAGTLASLDDDPLKAFAFHRCSISTTAQRIMELCRETLDDATNSEVASDIVDDALPPMLYRASRELLDLFRAIVPTTHAREIGSIPRVAAVLHNDCVYLAHESSLLGAEYKVKFRSLNLDESDQKSKTKLLGEICSFLDMVPPFRDLATKCMGSMIEKQKGQLYELVSPRLASFQQALASNESVTEWDDADTALRAALFHLRHLSQSWKLVLARDVYHMSMGNLVDLVLTLFLDPVLKSEAITEAASRFVHSLFFDAVRGAAEMFLVGTNSSQMMQTNETSTDVMQQRSFQVTKKYAALFDKSRAVGQFMCMRLDEIQLGLEEGVFRSVTARELSHLITAAFDDSNKRSALLNDLASR